MAKITDFFAADDIALSLLHKSKNRPMIGLQTLLPQHYSALICKKHSMHILPIGLG